MTSTTELPDTASRPLPHVDGVTHRFVDASGLNMHVAEAGDPDAPPLVMLHGWPQHWYMWRKQIPTLAEQFHVLAPDLRGLGWTDAPPSGYDKETLARDVINLLDALELERVSLMAHDWGGWAGFIMCLGHPERFERFLAMNVPPPWVPFNLKVVKASWRMWYQWVNASPWLGRQVVKPGSPWMQSMLSRTSARPDTWDAVARDTFGAQFAEPERARASQLYYRTFVTREFLDVARGRYARQPLAVPTRLLFGDDDFATPRVFLETDHSRHAKDFELEFIAGCGHFIAEEQPVLVTNRALEFLAGS